MDTSRWSVVSGQSSDQTSIVQRIPRWPLARPRPSSLPTRFLPARLVDTGDLTLERQRAEAQAADAKLAQVTARATAELAPVVLAAAELRLPRVLHHLCSGCHNPLQPQLSAIRLQLSAVPLPALGARSDWLLCALPAPDARYRAATGDSKAVTYAPWRKGIPKAFSRARAPLSSLAEVTMVMFIPLSFSTLEISISGKIS